MLARLTSRRASGKCAALLALGGLSLLAAFGADGSGATFVASASSPGATFATAADFNTVHVTLDDPGSPRRAPMALAATATSDRGIATVRFERSAQGQSQWTEVCTDTTAPYACTLSADGVYDLRAIAQDAAGYQRTSDTVAARRVDGTAPTVTLADPGTALHGTVRLTTTATDASGLSRVTLEYRRVGGAWQEICHTAGACDWNTAALPDGDYDLRAGAEDAVGNTAEALRSGLHVDNSAPVAAVAPLAPQVTGTITLSATVTDAGGSGIRSVVYEGRQGNTPWYPFCTPPAAPWKCENLNTTMAPDGTYEGRVTVTDNAGNVTSSAAQTIVVDNTAPTVTFTDPGTPLSGTVTLRATAGDGNGSGVASVAFQRAPANTASWQTICTGTAVQCAWATTTVTDGPWNLQVIVTDKVGRTTTRTLTNRSVDNTAPNAVTVQGANGGVAGTLDAGDAFTFTYSEAMAPASILSAWSGAPAPVAVRISNDTLSVLDPTKSTSLGLDVALGADVVDADAWFDATMTMSGAQVIVTLTAPTAGTVKPAGGTPTLTWTPSTAATDLAGNACSAGQALETGSADQDF